MSSFKSNQHKASRGRKSRNNGQMSLSRSLSLKPPQIPTSVPVRHTFRYVSTSGTSTTITSDNLIGAAGVMALSTTQVNSFYDSVKVVKISMWAPPASQGATSTTSVQWIASAASYSSNAYEDSDTTNSTAAPAVVHSRPPKGSVAAFWTSPIVSNVNMFILVAPIGTIIDVTLDLLLSSQGGGNQTYVSAAASAGVVYYLYLDGIPTHRYTPVTLPTTL